MHPIKEFRQQQSMTQKRLAYEAGIDPRTLRKIERGEQVSGESLRSVCRVLGISVTDISRPTTKSYPAPTSQKTTYLSPIAAFASISYVGMVATFFPTAISSAIIIGLFLCSLVVFYFDQPTTSKYDGKISGIVFAVLAAWLATVQFRFPYGEIYSLTPTPFLALMSSIILITPRLRAFLFPPSETTGRPFFHRLLMIWTILNAVLNVQGTLFDIRFQWNYAQIDSNTAYLAFYGTHLCGAIVAMKSSTRTLGYFLLLLGGLYPLISIAVQVPDFVALHGPLRAVGVLQIYMPTLVICILALACWRDSRLMPTYRRECPS